MPAIAVLFLCAPLGLALGRLAALLALAAAALLAVPADEARADGIHPGGIYSLHCAAGVNGDLATVIHLLGSTPGVDVNALDYSSYSYSCGDRTNYSYGLNTPLHHAAGYDRAGSATIAATLIAAGAAVNAKNRYGWTPLHRAANGNVSVVSLLLAAGADVNAKNNDGTTPLHRAVNHGRAAIAATLIAAGAEVNAKSNNGDTPLHRIAGGDRAAVAAALIAAGADLEAKNNGGDTPLHQATRNGSASLVSMLIAAGAEVNARDNRGETPLRETWSDSRNEFYYLGAAVAFVLIAAGGHWGVACVGEAVVNSAGPTPSCLCKSPNVETPDNCAAPSESVCAGLTPPKFYNATAGECVSFKPCAGGTLDRETNTCECAAPAVLDYAGNNCGCRSPNVGTAANCQAPGAQSCAEFHNPPRFYDAGAGECGRWLYPCHDSAVVKADNSGCECPEGAYAHGDPSGGEWVEARKSIPDTAVCHADHAPVAHDLDGWTVAITLNDPELVSHFIADHGQDPDADYALHLAARHSARSIVKLLLARGANPDAVDSDGDTPLHESARLSDTPDNVAMVSLLLDKGADPNLGNNNRWRPLDLAYGRTDSFPPRRKMMAALIAGGADWASECTGGKIPNEHYRPPEVSDCRCPNHLAVDNNGVCECPAETHAQVNGRCLGKGSAQLDEEIEIVRAELADLRAALVSLNLRLSLAAEAADAPQETLEEVAALAALAARDIAQRRNNFLALARAGLADADDAGPAPVVALSDTAATCRMLDGDVEGDARVCSGIDQNDTFCFVDSPSAFSCVGLFRHVRRCNDIHNRPALDPWHCAKQCADGLRARGARCKAD